MCVLACMHVWTWMLMCIQWESVFVCVPAWKYLGVYLCVLIFSTLNRNGGLCYIIVERLQKCLLIVERLFKYRDQILNVWVMQCSFTVGNSHCWDAEYQFFMLPAVCCWTQKHLCPDTWFWPEWRINLSHYVSPSFSFAFLSCLAY